MSVLSSNVGDGVDHVFGEIEIDLMPTSSQERIWVMWVAKKHGWRAGARHTWVLPILGVKSSKKM